MDESVSSLVFYVNGAKVVEESAQPEWTLLFYLRTKLRLTGTKLGCGEGGCGACTVMISRYDRAAQTILHYAVNACLTPICAVHGLAVTTVEGIGQPGDVEGQRQQHKRRLHAVQERLAKAHGSQCGFCTPGFVMSMYTLLRSNKKELPTMAQVEEGFQGNLCRCTGYRPILEGCRTLTRDGCCGGQANNGNGCCMDGQNGLQKNGDDDLNGNRDTIQRSICTTLTNESDFQESYLDSQEPIFPPLLQLSEELDQQYLIVRGERVTWYRPTRLEQLLQLKSQFPHAKIVAGNTEVALEMKFKHCDYPVLVSPAMIAETLAIERTEEALILGGAVTLSTFKEELERQVQQGPKESTRFFSALNQMLHWFAGKQIRNVAAIAGNIMTGSPISDLNPLFMAAGCVLTLQSHSKGIRLVTMDNHFFTGYRRNIVQPEEILLNISIPRTKADEYINGYKQSRRREDDIAIVNGAFRVLFHPGSSKIQEMSMAFGGMAPTTVMAVGTMDKLVGRCWDDDSLVEDVCRWMLEDLPLPPSVPGGMSSYRQSLCLSFFFKFHLQVLRDLIARRIVTSSIPDNLSGAELDIERGKFKSAQLFELVPKDQLDLDPVGRPLAHVAGEKHVTGEAIYCDDLPPVAGELHMALVLSNQAHAEIVSIDPSAALELEGVRGFFSAKDIASGRNVFGPIVHDEEVFASKRVTCCGQVIACVVADNLALAQRASRLVRVTYSPSDGPAIFTIQDAIKHNSFYQGHSREIIQGDVEAGFRNAQHVLEGTFEMGGQEHFYLETQSVLVVPKGEDGEMDITSSTQNPSEVQQVVAEVLGLPANRVVCRVKRMGGGFGGKETRSAVLAAPAAVASYRLQRPVRCMLDRDEDMMSTGIRHPFLAKYKVGFDSTGRLTALDVQLFSNGGNTMDLSRGIMERAVFHIDNAYRIENLRCHGIVCRTNLPSNTAFRGFGGPQGMAVVENVMVDVSTYLGLDPTAVRSLNLYREGDSTHYNQRLDYCTLDRCWNECQALAGLKDRRKEIESFNRLHRFKKRGLAIIPTKFGIAFTALFLNQAGALVHVYKDGSVLLTHGGTEMGQGLHTKMLQVASRALNIPVDLIFISETSTDKVPNTSPTAASAGSDLNGMAVLNACQILVDRLAPIRKAHPDGSWQEWVMQAYFQRISLSTTGFYKTPGIGYDFATNSGSPFRYFSFGAACSVVEVDCLTGNHRVLRTDIVMDLGESLNPAIDIGQVEGGFVQGLGLFTLEEPLFSPANGQVITRGPSNYKIPSADDIPEEFNVSLLRGCPNPHAVYSSKAVGEPPLFLASSVFFAIKDAIHSARTESGLTGNFTIHSPATAERIRMACEDHLIQKVSKPEPGTFLPWAASV
ncbi:hypothetical protein DAPPUDRAFT_303976 [Daphnia pulex]|uniref:xanthine dehydrogenase n=1 Tax=Daphnia pulex TaxID=6669 RepID=E9HT76_DAPPU|nr:hypothetical protein DAPPUDRAFT_303976 [Daphnia pulex]|eukprot:EFX65041.1 hypothetical protein DAPPUDRAFT_303976 [Daphnia pulex]